MKFKNSFIVMILICISLIFSSFGCIYAAENVDTADHANVLSVLGISCSKSVTAESFYDGIKSLVGYDIEIKYKRTITLQEAYQELSAAITGLWGAPSDKVNIIYEGLYKNVTGGNGNPLTYEDAVELLYNALFVNVYEVSNITSTGNFTLNRNNNDNILNYRFDAKIKEGIVTATEMGNIMDYAPVGKGYLRIGSEIYRIMCDLDNEFMIGRKVTVIVRENTEYDTFDLLDITLSKDDDTLTIKTNDIKSTSVTLIEYYDNDRRKTAKISRYADVLKNFGNMGNYTASDFKPSDGALLLNDYDGDGIYDFVHILEYRNYVAEAISEYSKTIIDLYGGSIVLDTDESDKIRIIKNGRRISFSEIAINDVLSVFEQNEKTKLVYITNKMVAGIVSIFDAEDKIQILNREIPLSAGYINAYKNSSKADEIKVRDMAMAYLDMMGYAAAIKYVGAENEGQYGYLTKISGESGIGDKIYMKIFTTASEEVSFAAAEKFKLNGVKCSADEFLKYPEFKTTYKEGKVDEFEGFKPQLVKYKLNLSNEITELETAKQGKHNEETKDIFTLDYKPQGKTMRFRDGRYLVQESGSENNKVFYYLDSGVPVFNVIQSDDGTVNAKNFRVETGIRYDENVLRDALVYDLDERMVPSAVVLVETNAGGNASDAEEWAYKTDFAVVKRVGDVIIDDEVRKAIYSVGGDGEEGKIYPLEEDGTDYITNLNIQKGDIVLIYVGINNSIRGLRKIYSHIGSPAEDTAVGSPFVKNIVYRGVSQYGHYNVRCDTDVYNYSNERAPYATYTNTYGTVASKAINNVISVNVGDYANSWLNNNVQLIKYKNDGSATIKKISMDDLTIGQTVFVQSKYYRTWLIYAVQYED